MLAPFRLPQRFLLHLTLARSSLSLSRAFQIATPEVTTHTIVGYGRIVLASDGLFDVISHDQVGAVAVSVAAPQRAARRLAALAQRQRQLTGRSPDDISIVVVDVFPSMRRIDGSSAQCGVM